MSFTPSNANGQATSANSAPVVLASDQTTLSVNEQHLLLLTRIAKALEGCSTIDAAQRLRITLDAITAGLTLSTVTSVGTVNTLTGITNALPAGANIIGSIANLAGMDREMYINYARTTYATAIRAKLN